MASRTNASSIAARARIIIRMAPGKRRARETGLLANRIYAEADRLHLGNEEVIALFSDGSALRMLPEAIRSLRLAEKRQLIRELAGEHGHLPRTPGHGIQYQRLVKTCHNLLDRGPAEPAAARL